MVGFSACHPVSYSLNSLKGGIYRGLYRGLLYGLLRGMLGVQTTAQMVGFNACHHVQQKCQSRYCPQGKQS